MSDAAQLYQKLLTDTIRKQMLILGPQITLLKIHNVPELTVSEDGTVASLGPKPEETVTRFLEEFRELSAPLVKKTMQPLLSALGPGITQTQPATPTNQSQTKPVTESTPTQTDNKNQGLVPKT
jgi:hypothetical protein